MVKPYKGKITNWKKMECSGGLGYFIMGQFQDRPEIPIVKYTNTSCVEKHNEETGEIETRNSRYLLIGKGDLIARIDESIRNGSHLDQETKHEVYVELCRLQGMEKSVNFFLRMMGK